MAASYNGSCFSVFIIFLWITVSKTEVNSLSNSLVIYGKINYGLFVSCNKTVVYSGDLSISCHVYTEKLVKFSWLKDQEVLYSGMIKDDGYSSSTIKLNMLSADETSVYHLRVGSSEVNVQAFVRLPIECSHSYSCPGSATCLHGNCVCDKNYAVLGEKNYCIEVKYRKQPFCWDDYSETCVEEREFKYSCQRKDSSRGKYEQIITCISEGHRQMCSCGGGNRPSLKSFHITLLCVAIVLGIILFGLFIYVAIKTCKLMQSNNQHFLNDASIDNPTVQSEAQARAAADKPPSYTEVMEADFQYIGLPPPDYDSSLTSFDAVLRRENSWDTIDRASQNDDCAGPSNPQITSMHQILLEASGDSVSLVSSCSTDSDQTHLIR